MRDKFHQAGRVNTKVSVEPFEVGQVTLRLAHCCHLSDPSGHYLSFNYVRGCNPHNICAGFLEATACCDLRAEWSRCIGLTHSLDASDLAPAAISGTVGLLHIRNSRSGKESSGLNLGKIDINYSRISRSSQVGRACLFVPVPRNRLLQTHTPRRLPRPGRRCAPVHLSNPGG